MKLYTYEELLDMGITPYEKPLDGRDWYFIKEGERIAALFAVKYKKE